MIIPGAAFVVVILGAAVLESEGRAEPVSDVPADGNVDGPMLDPVPSSPVKLDDGGGTPISEPLTPGTEDDGVDIVNERDPAHCPETLDTGEDGAGIVDDGMPVPGPDIPEGVVDPPAVGAPVPGATVPFTLGDTEETAEVSVVDPVPMNTGVVLVRKPVEAPVSRDTFTDNDRDTERMLLVEDRIRSEDADTCCCVMSVSIGGAWIDVASGTVEFM